jgi:hypothetical protein
MEPDFSYLHSIFARGSSLIPQPLYGSFYPVPKRSVFVSYHHGLDRPWYEKFSHFFSEVYDVFEDNSPERAKDSDYTDYIMWSVRDNHIKGSSCTIVLCGAETGRRKFVDWEIDATLDKEHDLIGVQLPTCTINNLGRALVPGRLHDNIASGYAVWVGWHALVQGGPDFLRAQIETANTKSKSLIQNDRKKMGRCMPSLSSIFQRPPSLFGEGIFSPFPQESSYLPQMQNGAYRVLFKGPSSEGRGLLVAKNGSLWGGDSSYVYSGSYTAPGPTGKASVQITRDDPSGISVFGNLQDFQLDLVYAIVPSGFTASGAIPNQPNAQIEINATKLADI